MTGLPLGRRQVSTLGVVLIPLCDHSNHSLYPIPPLQVLCETAALSGQLCPWYFPRGITLVTLVLLCKAINKGNVCITGNKLYALYIGPLFVPIYGNWPHLISMATIAR